MMWAWTSGVPLPAPAAALETQNTENGQSFLIKQNLPLYLIINSASVPQQGDDSGAEPGQRILQIFTGGKEPQDHPGGNFAACSLTLQGISQH